MGRTAMHLSAANGHRELISQLIGQGADINAPDEVSVDDRVYGWVFRVPERQSTERLLHIPSIVVLEALKCYIRLNSARYCVD